MIATTRLCPVCDGPVTTHAIHCSRACYRVTRARQLTEQTEDPTPEQIAEMTAAIRASWTEQERQSRLRADWKNVAWSVPRQTMWAESVSTDPGVDISDDMHLLDALATDLPASPI